ncbi:MAG TPA: ABC transporter substrate-binding protein [Burkholderiaceae bacterium]|nr:ABC transporter substrate-binding protein [Burkholderiaceae bacterium]
MERRTAAAWLAGSTVIGAFRAHAQGRDTMPVVGFLNSATAELYQFNVAAFGQGLEETGYTVGRNVAIEFRWAGGDYGKLAALAKELVERNVAVIAATGDVASARAAQAATRKTPVVFTIGGDPVRYGLVESYGRPGGNLTGISLISSNIGGKRIEVLHEIAREGKFALIMNPDNPNATAEQGDAEQAARGLGHPVVTVQTRNARDFDAAFQVLLRERPAALFIGTDPMLLSQRARLVEFAEQQQLPAIYFVREFALAGGLISYGASIREMYRQAGIYAGRILRGAKASELPVLQPTIIEVVVNLKAAKALNLKLPQKLMLLANEVID